MGFACACLLAWQVAGGPATQPDFNARVAEFDARSRQMEAALTPEARGRATLEWLQALGAVLKAVPFDKVGPVEQAWLDAHENLVVYSVPAGMWLIQDDVIWRAHGQHHNSAAADEIAWLAVTNGLPGECEGYVPCYAFGMDRLEGEYLRRHPHGGHRGEALGKIGTMLTIALDDLLKRPYAKDFLNVPSDCADLLKSARPLRHAVAAVKHPETGRTLALVDRLIAQCPVEPRICAERR